VLNYLADYSVICFDSPFNLFCVNREKSRHCIVGGICTQRNCNCIHTG